MSEALYVGVDVGSSATKCVILDRDRTLIGQAVVSSGFDYEEAGRKALAGALVEADGATEDVATCIATGYGRKSVTLAARCVTELTCHARGAREWYPHVRGIIDIGGQDTKVIRLDESGKMTDYRMNAKCAAGTGTFLEAIALKLGLSLPELDALAMKSTSETVVNSYCTVFAGTEVIERIKEGQAPEDIAMGLFRSIASRIAEMGAMGDLSVGVTGGVVSHCQAMVRALEGELEAEVLLPPMPQHAGAFGAALLAAEIGESGKDVSCHAAQG